MTNGEKMQEVFPEGKTRRCRNGVVFESDGWCHAYDSDWWNAEYKELSRQSRPVIHANWLSGDCKGAHCSNCEEYTPFVYGAYNFCPNCGADMREVEE